MQGPNILWLWLTMSRGGCYVLMLVIIFICKNSSQLRHYWSLSRKVVSVRSFLFSEQSFGCPAWLNTPSKFRAWVSVKRGWLTPPHRLPLRIIRTRHGEPPHSDTCNRPQIPLANGTDLQPSVISEILAQLLQKGEQYAVGLVTRLSKIPIAPSSVDQ